MGPKPIVLIAEELSATIKQALGSKFEIRFVDGTDRKELLAAMTEADAVLVRSATIIDREALSVAEKLMVVARAGVGLDNIDVNAEKENCLYIFYTYCTVPPIFTPSERK